MKKYKRGTTLYDFCISENKSWILEQFDAEKNYPLTAKDYTKSSDQKAWFRFKDCGHSCLQRIADKTGKNSRLCPMCLNRGAIGKSLLSEYPDYANMFDSDQNEISPENISFQNGKSYWWICPRCNSKFKGKVSDVVNGKRVCNEYSNKKRSFPEYCLAYYFLKIDNEREIDKNIGGYKFDFFLPKFNLVIEYDGYPWHNTSSAKENDSKKDEICKNQNLTLFRLRDDRLDDIPLSSNIWKFTYDDNFSFLEKLDERLSEILKTDKIRLDIDVRRDLPQIRKFQFDLDKKGSLIACIPTLYEYLDPENDKNGKPEYVCTASRKIHFWLRHPKYKI